MHFEDHNPNTLPKSYNKDKGKRMLVNDKTTIDISKQLSIVVNNAYKHNLSWSKEEHEIKFEAILDPQENDYFQKANEEKQLIFMLELVHKLENERINRIGPFLQFKEDEVKREIENKSPS